MRVPRHLKKRIKTIAVTKFAGHYDLKPLHSKDINITRIKHQISSVSGRGIYICICDIKGVGDRPIIYRY